MTVVVELNIIPLGVGMSVSKCLAPALAVLAQRGVKHQITPMCTIFEVRTVNEAYEVVEAAHEAVFKAGANRVVTTVKVDDRRDVTTGMAEKVASLQSEIGTT
jgi:uncharacterized protein (TIGR00106 family)